MHQKLSSLRLFSVCGKIIILALGIANHACAQASPDFKTLHARNAASNPAGVMCVLKLPSNRTRFHMGEVIPIEAIFTSNDAGKYRLNTTPENRNLPWSSDTFFVDRENDAPDALCSYYDPLRPYGYGGGGPAWQTLTTTSISLRFTLNEWRRFDYPGVYRIYLKSARVQSRTSAVKDILSLGPLTTTSNILEIQILSFDSVWSSQALAQSLPAFQSKLSDTEEGRSAAQVIRFLDTPKSIQAIIARYGATREDDIWHTFWYQNAYMGLLGSRQRHSIVAQMKAKIFAPDFPIDPAFITDLAQVQTLIAYPDPIPPTPKFDPAMQAAWNKMRSAKFTAPNRFTQSNCNLLRIALPNKHHGAAHDRSAQTLLEFTPK